MESDHINTRLNSKNFALWEFQFRTFIKGQGFFGFLDGSATKPAVPPATDQELAKWMQSDAKVRSWILKSVDPSIVLGLRLLPTSADEWQSLKATYSSTSVARQFEIEIELANLQQGDQDVTTYYNAAKLPWTKQDLLAAALLSGMASAEFQA
ncbi:unnamed protein product [Linum trigynum]|uniref:Retrotransposon Copia-like N-terminal domain-containing protein n=1 Tax=Linum trigynum TaxID=586398 RepID=A0AAV2GI77_9ROSI